MNGRAIRIVYGKELRDSLRDRRTIISMIVVPVLVIPLLMLGLGAITFKTVTKARQEVPQVMIIGGENSPKVLAALHAAKNLQIVPATEDFTNQIVEKRVNAAVKLSPDFDAAVARGEKTGVKIYEYEGEMKSGFAAGDLNDFFQNLRDTTVRERLQKPGRSGGSSGAVHHPTPECRAAGKGRREPVRRDAALYHHHHVLDGRHVSGDRRHRRREGTGDDGNDSLLSGGANRPGVGKISDGSHRLRRDGLAVAVEHGGDVPLCQTASGAIRAAGSPAECRHH